MTFLLLALKFWRECIIAVLAFFIADLFVFAQWQDWKVGTGGC
jgi:hypothetical protein